MLTCALGAALAACGGAPGPADQSTGRTDAADAAGTTAPDAAAAQSGEDDVAPAATPETPVAKAFAVTDVPVSEVALGEFPYLRLPSGYVFADEARSDFDRIAFWTGDRLEWVEGRVYSAAVRGDKAAGKTFALLEYRRNMRAAIEQAGGQRIAEGQWPRPLRDELKATDPDLGVRYNGGLGDIWNEPVETYVIRRPDRQVWLQVTGYRHGGNLLMAETTPLEITAGLLEAEALKQQLDVDGRVAIEVNFAVDEATILPGSQPQIDQVLELLRADPSLRLSVDGHTDDTGDAAHNRRLSEARAKAVVASLVAQGIDAARLEANGYGPAQPIADNTSEEGRARNRRVELVRLD